MRVPVMYVGIVRVGVDQRLVHVCVGMRFARRVGRSVDMLVVFVMNMSMAV